MNDKLKKIIFDKLYMNLSNAEVLEHKSSTYILDRERKYWFLDYRKSSGKLFWKEEFFSNFFLLFSMNQNEYEPIIGEWVEEVLNCKVTKSIGVTWSDFWIKEILKNEK